MDFSTRLKQARRKAKVSQESLGEACSVSKSAVSQWETGGVKGTVPDFYKIPLICKKLKVSADYLILGTEPEQLPPPDVLALAKKIIDMPEERKKALSDIFGQAATDEKVSRHIPSVYKKSTH